MTKEEVLETNDKIAKAIEKVTDFKGEGDLDLEHMIYASTLFKPQKYTPEIEKQLVLLKGWREVDKSRNCGDYIDKNGDIFELKISVGDNNKINALQLREFQGGFKDTKKKWDELKERIVNADVDIYNEKELEKLDEIELYPEGSWAIIWFDEEHSDAKIYEKKGGVWRYTNKTLGKFAGVDYYLFIYFDRINPLQNSKAFKIKHDDINSVFGSNVQATHLVKNLADKNTHVERSLHFKTTSRVFSDSDKSKFVTIIEASKLFDNSDL